MALVGNIAGSLSRLHRHIHPGRDIAALLVQVNADAKVAWFVADLLQHTADNELHVHTLRAGNLTGDNDVAFRRHDLAGDTGGFIHAQAGAQNAVGDQVAELIGMARAHGLTGLKCGHMESSLSMNLATVVVVAAVRDVFSSSR